MIENDIYLKTMQRVRQQVHFFNRKVCKTNKENVIALMVKKSKKKTKTD